MMWYIFWNMNKLYMIFISKSMPYKPWLVKHGNVSDVIYLSKVRNLQKFTKKLPVTILQLQNQWLCSFLKYGGGGIRTHELLRERISYRLILSPSRLTGLRYPSNERDCRFLHITSSVDILSSQYRKIIWKQSL